MKNSLLIPNAYKVCGWIVFLLAVALHIAIAFFELPIYKIPLPFEPDGFSDGTINDEIILSLALIGLVLVAFAKEKKEDEFISFLRLKSWQWAILISYGILFVANWLIFGLEFLSFMTYNMFTVLLVFILKFNYSLYLLKKGDKNEN
jgi:hypothetical protein